MAARQAPRIEADRARAPPATPPRRPSRGSGSRSGSGAAARPGRPRGRGRGSGSSARRRDAAASTCRRRCGPSARPARRRRRQADAAQDRRPVAELVPDAVDPEHRVAGAPTRRSISARSPAPRRWSWPARGASPRSRSARAGALDARVRRQAEPREQPRPGRLERRRGGRAHARNSCGEPSNAIRPAIIAITRSAAPRQRSSRCSASRIVDVGVLVEPPQQPDQLIAGDRVELRGRLVEHDELRAGRRARRRARRAGARRRTARPSGGRAGRRSPSASAASSTAAGDRRRGLPAVLEPERELGPDGAHHDLRLGVLEQRADGGASSPGPWSRRVESGDRRPAGERAAVEVRDEAARGAQQRRLARSRRAGDDDELARARPRRLTSSSAGDPLRG